MEDLVSATDFSREDAAFATRIERLGALAGALAGAVLIFVFLMPWTEPPADRRSAILTTLGWSLLFGSALSLGRYLIVSRAEMASVADRLQRVFRSDPAIVPPAPADATHRVLCVLYLSRGRSIGGFLYVTRSGLVFQHHRWSRSAWQMLRATPEPGHSAVAMGPPSTITLDLVDALHRPWYRRVPTQRTPGIWVRWGGEYGMMFCVMRLEETLRRLQECVDWLRRQEAETS